MMTFTPSQRPSVPAPDMFLPTSDLCDDHSLDPVRVRRWGSVAALGLSTIVAARIWTLWRPPEPQRISGPVAAAYAWDRFYRVAPPEADDRPNRHLRSD